MHRHSVSVLAPVAFVLATAATSTDAAIKKIPYPEVKVQVEQYKSDDALMAMRRDVRPFAVAEAVREFGEQATLAAA